ncbi:NEDD8-conjugating protein ubc12 [Coemansia javaensis]|uniref:NEDD8-conjugating enzyme UBC12 n=1 Tax=Coemansia javaensis TaxID=2761396 RepID=A0A9W8LJZ6_9FUNG|nr:NEDD8-conjugating protein ubc12 [Coemansia javaensis]
MHKIWKQKKTEAELQKTPRESPARLRLQKELGELVLTPDTEVTPSADNIMEFVMTYRPTEGYYKDGEFKFQFEIDKEYPHEVPKVRCMQTIFHPNIDTDGKICLNILREDWRPVLNIQAVIFGLQSLFQIPNADDPLNKDAARLMNNDPAEFARTVRLLMRGRTVGSIRYDDVLVKKV